MGFQNEADELLALLLEEEGFGLEATETIQPRDPAAEPQLSFAQARLWFLYQLDPNDPSYNISAAVHFQGELNVPVLETCFVEIIERHEALRTRFLTVNGQPKQAIDAQVDFAITVVDLTGLDGEEQAAEVDRLLTVESAKPFKLDQEALIRAVLMRTGETEHTLCLTIHHIVSDGWSMGVFTAEVAALYEAYLDDKASPLPPLQVQYADFAAWQREVMQGETYEKLRSYWTRQLHGELPVLQLPADRPHPAEKTMRGQMHKFRIPKDVAKGITALGQQEEASLYMTLLAAYKALLHRYSGQEDLILGTPIANRSRPELEGLIGFLANTLVLRTDLSGRPTFRELLQRVRTMALEGYEHQDMPFVKLVEEVQPNRDVNVSPLIQAMFVLQNAPKPSATFNGLTVSMMGIESKTAKFDVSLFLTEDQDGLEGVFEYNTDLFDAETIERMGTHYCNLLAAVLHSPDTRIDELVFLSAAERRDVLAEGYRELAYDRDATMHGLFERQAALTPDAPAVVDGERSLTYRELNEAANRLAHHLLTLGAGPDVPVGIYLERSLEIVVAILAVLKTGGAYLPLDPSYPQERLLFMLEDTAAPVLLTQSSMQHDLTRAGLQVLALDAGSVPWQEAPSENLPAATGAEGLAYIIYTSGTTGKPKGVLVPHRGVVNLMADMHRLKPLGTGDRSSVWTSFGFDVSVYELFSALFYGAAVYPAPEAVRYDSRTFFHWLRDEGITSAYLPPFMFKDLANWLSAGNGGLALQLLMAGVEPLSERLLGTIMQQVPGLLIFNGYGPTETTISPTFYVVDAQAPERQTPIGKAVANTRLYLLDHNLQPVPNGIAGEVYIGGDMVVRGYLNRPEETEQRFLPDPYCGQPDGRMYKTGDLARRLPDGNLLFLGRIDQQVKIRGFRIELGEIEAQLIAHEAVREAVVTVREAVPGDKRLVAYIVPSAGAEQVEAELRARIGEQLPGYMMPSAFVLLDALPLTPNGKIDRKALPVPDFAANRSERAYIAPSTPTEQQLAALWSQLLGVEAVGVSDNFFELGGHSLLAMQMIAQVQSDFHVALEVRSLFDDPSLGGLARMIDETETQTAKPEIVALSRQARKRKSHPQ
ncbi:amino acid adenylation domain-containing protein [Tumebacillus sp. BK434]|uniref:non-ribosomal peptide synthetase n=1 Tax=Tumebacillus sp. BK434 TaxID=2512169 RepID=UPI001043996A|nr:non-ribosomal peptide synthetase [Tumebacillus sp. BK434]TCP54489.1 amino acid adenylation domain-containing protein [Tumebacillus sp. BK434]